jgi:hypothetical protein
LKHIVEPVPEGNGTDASGGKVEYQLYFDNPKNVNQNIGEEGEKPEIGKVEDLVGDPHGQRRCVAAVD